MMRERMARAMCKAVEDQDWTPMSKNWIEEGWHNYLPQVDAALAAMLEPTVAMVKAGSGLYEVDEFGVKSAWPSDTYQAMIKEAMKK
jgi:hypothetical protein